MFEIKHKDVTFRVIELRKPDLAANGTSHGVLLVETGPLAGAKAFFNRR